MPTAGKANIIGIAVDIDNDKLWGRVGGGNWTGLGNPATNSGGNSITSVVSGSVFPAWSALVSGVQATANFGASAFDGVAPSGFSSWGSSCVWDPANKDASITLSNGNLTATGTAAAWKSVRGTVGHAAGKYYYELTVDSTSSALMVGIENGSGTLNDYLGSTTNGAGYNQDSNFYINAISSAGLLSPITHFCNFPRSVRSTTTHTTGKYYAEVTCDSLGGAAANWLAGVLNVSQAMQNYIGFDDNGAAFQADRTYNARGVATPNVLPNALTATHVLCLAVDLDNSRLWARVDGNAWSGASGDPTTNTGGQDIHVATNNGTSAMYIGMTLADTSSFSQGTATFRTPFAQAIPSGFVRWDP